MTSNHPRRAVVLLSGGMDSTVALYDLLSQGYECAAISFDYGQRHRRELEAAIEITGLMKVRHNIVGITSTDPLFRGSSQTAPEIAVPHGHYADESMRVTVVPNRNMIMISIAAAWALSLDYNTVCYAAHSGDHAIYPDCRPEFVAAMFQALRKASYNRLPLLIAPFLRDSKAEIVRRGAKLRVPFQQTWSCYEGGMVHCGKCGTCVERIEAFQLAGVPDPTVYTADLVKEGA